MEFATVGGGGVSPASQRSDFNAVFGTLSFYPGESSKTFRVLINEDSRDGKPAGRPGATFGVWLRDTTGGFFVGTRGAATVLIIDDPVGPAPNAIDDTDTFVCQHYQDFLDRDPDSPGMVFRANRIDLCGNDQACVERQRVLVSGAFSLSIEFQETGYLVYRTYARAFGKTRTGSTVPLTISGFLPDVLRIGRDVIGGQGEQRLRTGRDDALSYRPSNTAAASGNKAAGGGQQAVKTKEEEAWDFTSQASSFIKQ